MWISKEEAKKYRAYQDAAQRISKNGIIYGDDIIYLSRNAWDAVAHEVYRNEDLRKAAAQELEAAHAEAEEWKHKYADEFQKRMALLDRLIQDNADEDVHTGYHPEHEW